MKFIVTLTDTENEVLGEYTVEVSDKDFDCDTEDFDMDDVIIHPKTLAGNFKAEANELGQNILSDINAIYRQRIERK